MNNTVIIWLLLPILLGLGLVTIQRLPKLSALLGSLFPLVLAVLALIYSKGLTLNVLGRYFTLTDNLVFFGRATQITADQLGIIALLYFLCFAWNVMSGLFNVGRWFNSLTLIITALWASVQVITPFLYSAVVVELIALFSVPLLSPRGTPAKKTLHFHNPFLYY